MRYSIIIAIMASSLTTLPMDITNKLLFKAARKKDHAQMNTLLSSKMFSPNSTNSSGLHIFLYTVTHSSLECMQTLVDHKTNLAAIDEMDKGNTALHKAYNNRDKTELLFRCGADINSRNSLLCTPLHYCIERHGNMSVIKFLLEKKDTDIDAVDNRGETALHKSLLYPTRGAMKALLKKGASVNIFDNTGHTVLHYAAQMADLCAIQLLLKHGANAHLKTANKKQLSTLQLAMQADDSAPHKVDVITLFTLLTIPVRRSG